MHVKPVKSSNVLPLMWCGSWKRGCQLRCRPRHLISVQNYEVHRQKPCVAEQCDVNIPHSWKYGEGASSNVILVT
ncbi:hypothetical protein TNCV_454191 [Trichonephila clavipes]|nr:hypothetical protein TNCV_454191 [Trichonephila clavipes]